MNQSEINQILSCKDEETIHFFTCRDKEFQRAILENEMEAIVKFKQTSKLLKSSYKELSTLTTVIRDYFNKLGYEKELLPGEYEYLKDIEVGIHDWADDGFGSNNYIKYLDIHLDTLRGEVFEVHIGDGPLWMMAEHDTFHMLNELGQMIDRDKRHSMIYKAVSFDDLKSKIMDGGKFEESDNMDGDLYLNGLIFEPDSSMDNSEKLARIVTTKELISKINQ